MPRTWLLLLIAFVTTIPDVLAADKPLTIHQITTDSKDHRWPSVNNLGDIVWAERDANGRWQVVLKLSGSNAAPQQITQTTSQFSFFQYPAIDNNRNVLVAAYSPASGQYWLLLYPYGQANPQTIEFSSRNGVQHRDAGIYSALSQDGSAIWYYDFFSSSSSFVRRLNISGMGRLSADYRGYDFPAINSVDLSGNRQTLLTDSTGTLWMGSAGATTNPIGNPIASSVYRGRLNDRGDVVATRFDGKVVAYFPPEYEMNREPKTLPVWSGTCGSTCPWADINTDRLVVFEDIDASGNWQIYTRPILQGIDKLDLDPGRWSYFTTNYDPKYLIATAWRGGHVRAPGAEAALASAPQGVKKAAYCFLNFDNSSVQSLPPDATAPAWQDGGWQVKQCLYATGAQVTELSFLALDVEFEAALPGVLSVFERRQRIAEAVQAIYDHNISPVIYTSWRVWTSRYFGNTTSFSNIPLWRADEVNPGDHQNDMNLVRLFKPDLLSFYIPGLSSPKWGPFGGWQTLSARQYAANFSISGANADAVDLNLFDPYLFLGDFVPPRPERDVSAVVAVAPSGLTYVRQADGSRIARGDLFIRNNGSEAIDGPLQIVFLSSGNMTVLRRSGSTSLGLPYLCVPLEARGLAPGETVTVPVSFLAPSVSARPTFTFGVISGYFSNPTH